MSEDVKTYVVVEGQSLDTTEYDLPKNLRFSDAWAIGHDQNNKQIVVIDIEKAKEVWKDRMREARTPILSKLDSQYFMALEKQDTDWASSIAQTKQLLRDVTKLPELLSATTIEEIESIWPEILNNKGN